MHDLFKDIRKSGFILPAFMDPDVSARNAALFLRGLGSVVGKGWGRVLGCLGRMLGRVAWKVEEGE